MPGDEEMNMVGASKRAFGPVPDDFFDVSEAEQQAVCLQMAPR